LTTTISSEITSRPTSIFIGLLSYNFCFRQQARNGLK